MSLAPGTRFGPYAITTPLGAGGMGEVYRARDDNLDRDVAVKVLPEAFADDAERLARFEREAKVLASLNHPNIGAIYGLERSGETRALVLELVEGPTLAERLDRGAIPIDEAIATARQIAEALEAAHEQDVVHRDLKPANIKVTPDGVVKVLDFGLARPGAAARSGGSGRSGESGGSGGAGEAGEDDPANSPTMTGAAGFGQADALPATQAGMVLGTVGYMSPEQARGKPVDRRADIWAFGAVLFEMLTGRRAFEGATASDTIAAVLRSEPDWSALPAGTPMLVVRLLRRCLDKEPRERLQHIGDARVELRDASVGESVGPEPSPTGDRAAPGRRGTARRIAPWALGAVAGALLAALWLGSDEPGPPPAPVIRFTIDLPVLTGGASGRALAFSPDGRQIVSRGTGGLQLWTMDRGEATVIPGTAAARSPFFSPDGEWVGFFEAGSLRKIAIAGGVPVTLAAAPSFPMGATWGADDRIVFADIDAISVVSGGGGETEVLVRADESRQLRQPQLLPDGRTLLFTRRDGVGTSWSDARIVARSTVTGDEVVLVEGGTDARYLETGHLLYVRGQQLVAVPFEPARLATTGAGVVLVDGIAEGWYLGEGQFSVASTGTLAYLTPRGSDRLELVWVSRTGSEEALGVEPQRYTHPRISPGGRRLVMTVDDLDLWLWELDRQTLGRLTFESGTAHQPIWSPDGERVAYGGIRDSLSDLYWQRADSTGSVERLTNRPPHTDTESFSPDGRFIVFSEENFDDRARDIGIVSVEGQHDVRIVLSGPFNERNGEVSPDGRRIAYQADLTGDWEIYVSSFPDGAGRYQVSSAGGRHPVWAPDGSELFFLAPDGALMAAPVLSSADFRAGVPTLLFRGAYFTAGSRQYDVAPDGQRFLFIKEEPEAEDDNLVHVIVNWHEELPARMP